MKLNNIPDEVFIEFLSKYLTFRDLGNLIKTSQYFRNIYDNNEFWRKIYLMTCPDKWEFTDNSKHLDYSDSLRCAIIEMGNSWEINSPIDIHDYNQILKIWNCQCTKYDCDDITHYDISTLRSTKIRNYNYKNRVIDKARSRLNDKNKNIIFLKQLIFPKRLEWYDIIGCDTFFVN